MESGGSNGSFGTHCGGRKTMVIMFRVPRETRGSDYEMQLLEEAELNERRAIKHSPRSSIECRGISTICGGSNSVFSRKLFSTLPQYPCILANCMERRGRHTHETQEPQDQLQTPLYSLRKAFVLRRHSASKSPQLSVCQCL